MKNLKIYLLAVVAAFCTISTWSQKIYKSNSHLASYLNAISPEQRPIEQNVQKVFSKQNEVNVIDFEGTEIVSPSALYRQSIQSLLRKENFFGVPNKAAIKTLLQQNPGALTMVILFNNKKITVDLVKEDILGDDFKVMTDKNPNGEAVQLGSFYRGVVRG
jgi:hypothetical protein